MFMLEDVGLWLYDLNRCGYYPWRGGAAALFGGIESTFDSLRSWAHGKPLGQTTTFAITRESNLTEVFLLGMHKAGNGDFLVGVWNRLPGNRNHVASVGVADLVGAASAEVTAVDANRIPGYATYFWVLPEANRIATVRLKHLNNGLANFQHYVTNFLTYINPAHVVLDEPDEDGGLRVQGYRRDRHANIEEGSVRPAFSVKSISLGGDLAFLREHVGIIEKVCIKTQLSTAEPRGYRAWELFQDVGRFFRRPGPVIEEVPIKLEMPASFDIDSLNQTIAAWTDDLNDVESRENDIGFKLRGHSNFKWLSKTQARKSVSLDVEWVDNELVNLESLMAQLQRQRAELLLLG
jgi:hypothetical protein